MSQTNWEADKMLDVYIYDYLIKRNLHASAKAFQAEGKISTDPVAISAPGGFLFEWWSVFWDIFIARTNEKHSETAASYIETQLIKARELQQQQHQRPQQPQQQMQMQQLLLQRQAQQQQQQQQQRIETQSLNGTHNGLVGNEPFMRQNPGAANALARKMIEDRLKLPLQSDNLDEAILKQRFCDSMGQILDPNHTSVLKSAPVGGQPPGRTLQMPGGISGNPQQVQNRILQLPVSAKDLKSEMSPMMNLRAAGQEGSLIGVHGSNQGDNNLTLKGWPLTGLDQLRSGFFQQQKSLVQSPQPFHQLQLQQQLLLQAQQNMTSPSASEMESRKIRMLLHNRSMSFGKDDNLNSVGDAIPNVGSPMQINGTVMSRGDTDMLMKADMDRFVDDGSLEDNVESFLTPNEAYPRDTVGRSVDVSKGFTFTEFRIIPASAKVQCCHFSSDGKLLATGGHDKKAVLWCTQTFTTKSTLEEHSQMITDVRFSPSMPRLATSSADKTVRIWDADNPGYSLRNFAGHSAIVTSLDFHPSKEDLIGSCDANGEIRYWSINNGNCARVFKGGMTQVRFQPRHGRYLAAAAEKTVSIIDVETQACRLKLQGHKKPVNSLCWDPSGEYLASVSEDVVKVWAFGSGSKGECINELSSSGSEFHSCVFHPTCTSLLVIGCYKSLELWNMNENKMMSLPAHDDVIASLAISNATGLVASASHDNCVKFWK